MSVKRSFVLCLVKCEGADVVIGVKEGGVKLCQCSISLHSATSTTTSLPLVSCYMGG